MSFKDAIVIFLKKCKAADKHVKEFIATENGEQADLFEAAIE